MKGRLMASLGSGFALGFLAVAAAPAARSAALEGELEARHVRAALDFDKPRLGKGGEATVVEPGKSKGGYYGYYGRFTLARQDGDGAAAKIGKSLAAPIAGPFVGAYRGAKIGVTQSDGNPFAGLAGLFIGFFVGLASGVVGLFIGGMPSNDFTDPNHQGLLGRGA